MVVAQTILLVAFNYFDKPQSICLKYYFQNLHKGAKQTFMYLFLSQKLFYFIIRKVAFLASHISFIKTLLYFK